MYKNEIYEMDQMELLFLVGEHDLDIDITKDLDCDEVIEALEYSQGKVYESAEDDIVDSIYNGNWTYAVEQMDDMNIYPSGLVDYIEDYRFEIGDEAYEWFNLTHASSITELFYQTRKVA